MTGRTFSSWILLLALLLPAEKARTQTHSIVVGGVTSQSARFWVRGGSGDEIVVEVARDTSAGALLQSSTENATPEQNFAVLVQLDGLEPQARYHYRPVINGVRGRWWGSFTTFPAPLDPVPFTFAFGSCQQSGSQLPSGTEPGNVFREVVRAEPLFFLQLGDWGYPDTTDTLPLDSTFFAGDFARIQQTYLTKYDQSYPMDSLLRIAPVAYVYDDHDFMNDNASALSSPFSVPYMPNPYGEDYVLRDIGNPPGARENSIRAYKENSPSYPLVNDSRGIYQKFACGTAEIFLLDLRSQRRPNLEPFVKNSETGRWEYIPGPAHSILGRETAPGSGESQFSWLLRELKASTATWKFLVSSVPFNQGFRAAIDAGVLFQALPISNPLVPPGTSLLAASIELADKWAGFPADGDSLLSWLAAEGIENVIVLSGDSHTAAIDDGANAGLPEIMAGGLDITNSQIVDILDEFGIKIWNSGGQGLTTESFDNAFGKVTVFGNDSVRLALVDEFGTEFASHTVRTIQTGVDDASLNPGGFALHQNYPNPFNPSTTIEFVLPARASVRLSLYSILGQQVEVLLEEVREAGTHRAVLVGRNLASGTYFCRLEATDARGVRFIGTRVLTLIR